MNDNTVTEAKTIIIRNYFDRQPHLFVLWPQKTYSRQRWPAPRVHKFFFSGPRVTAKSRKTPPLGDFCLAVPRRR